MLGQCRAVVQGADAAAALQGIAKEGGGRGRGGRGWCRAIHLNKAGQHLRSQAQQQHCAGMSAWQGGSGRG
eukprot:1158711-Pelagomonas_calceolata.AAC.9